ncbi:MAG: hypothetical protein A2017_10985 [Lentisphaerae bacterium GWF2_44_16]|nr:MAG: hypothetical protein A2017_10985 [Lentisphaerae bacterium GWF2_44_16]
MIYNLTKKKIISRNPVYATGFLMRGRGMIGRSFTGFDAMVFERCNCIHTMFMSMEIDVLFVNFENKICGVRRRLVPWKPLVRCKNAFTVIELPSGALETTGTGEGDYINLRAELSDSESMNNAAKDFLKTAETIISFSEND